jgi:hypothetical protein
MREVTMKRKRKRKSKRRRTNKLLNLPGKGLLLLVDTNCNAFSSNACDDYARSSLRSEGANNWKEGRWHQEQYIFAHCTGYWLPQPW